MMDDEGELTTEAKLGIYKGLLDYHLGRLFSHEEVFSGNPYYILRRKLKKLYWKLRKPFQAMSHRNCEDCKRLKSNIKDLTKLAKM